MSKLIASLLGLGLLTHPLHALETVADTPTETKILENKSKFGFAQFLPLETQVYCGILNVPKHLETFQKTQFWKDFQSVNPKAKLDSLNPLKSGFFSIESNGDTFIKNSKTLFDLYKEIGNPAGFLKVSNNPEFLQKLTAAAEKFEVATILAGAQIENGEALFKSILSEKAKEEYKKVTKYSKNSELECFQFKLNLFFTDIQKAGILAALPPQTTPENKKTWEKILETLQTKNVTLAYGYINEHLIFGIAETPEDFLFEIDAQESLISNPEFVNLIPFLNKNVLGIHTTKPNILEAIYNTKPLTPILQGITAILEQKPDTAPTSQTLTPILKKIEELQTEVFSHTSCIPQTGISWWENGIHAESFGGSLLSIFDYNTPNKLHRLLDNTNILAGVNYQAAPEYKKKINLLLSALLNYFETGAKDLENRNAGTDKDKALYRKLSTSIPELQSIQKTNQTIENTALGKENALILELGGKIPETINIPSNLKNEKMLRIAGILELKDPSKLKNTWSKLEAPLQTLFKQDIEMGEIQTEEMEQTQLFSYPGLGPDLSPTLAIQPHWMILSSSKDLAKTIQTPKPEDPTNLTGIIWKINIQNIKPCLQTASKLQPNNKFPFQLLNPFGNISHRIWLENQTRRDSFYWEIQEK